MLLTACCLVFFGTALADQIGNKRWCNSDQYGCWVTGSGGGQNYIMFWSESARDLFMGPDSKAPVVKRYPEGELALDPAPTPAPPVIVPVPVPDPVTPEEDEEAEQELSQEQKLEAIRTYMTEKGLKYSEEAEPFLIPKDDFQRIADYLEINAEDFTVIVNDVYAMVNEDKPVEIYAYLYEVINGEPLPAEEFD